MVSGGGIIQTLRARQRPGGGGPFFGTSQVQLFTPKFTASSYASVDLTPGAGLTVALLYRIHFSPTLQPNAFTFQMTHRAQWLLNAVLSGGYIEDGFGDDGNLVIPITDLSPLRLRVQNDDTIPQMWSADFDLLTIESDQEWKVVLAYLNDEQPDVAAILAEGWTTGMPGAMAPPALGPEGGFGRIPLPPPALPGDYLLPQRGSRGGPGTEPLDVPIERQRGSRGGPGGLTR